MGALQSKIWSDVSTDETPASPSEIQPLSSNGKPMAPFRDPRSISDDVERTPIQIAADKSKESSKSDTVPEVEQTPTGPSFAARFKAASIDPRSPGGLGLTRTPIIIKEDLEDEKSLEKKGSTKENIDSVKPIRGTATFVDRLQETAEMEIKDISEVTASVPEDGKNSERDQNADKIESSDKDENEFIEKTQIISKENDSNQLINVCGNAGLDEKLDGLSLDDVNDYDAFGFDEDDVFGLNDSDFSGLDEDDVLYLQNSSIKPDAVAIDDTKISKEEDTVSTPGNTRCGKKTMFPMVFAYEEAKSPRSPLGQLNLNTNFLASPANSDKKALSGSGDFSNNIKQDQWPLPKISFEPTNIGGCEKENQNDTNTSLVI